MLNESEKYLLSLYQTVNVISENKNCVTEKVFNSYDGLYYIKRTYKEDKRDIFNRLAGISHTSLPAVSGVFFNDSTVVIEEFIAGTTLRELIDSGGITPKRAYSIAEQLLSALGVLHKNGIIHRDIKPENIIVTPTGRAYLIDFDIARLYDESSYSDTQAMGTQGYAAPEQYGFSQSDSRTDIYSLGATLNETVKNVKGARAVKRVAKRCMSFDPAARYQSAYQALKSLILFRHLPAVLICAACAVCACVFFIYSYSLQTAPPVSTEDEAAFSISPSTPSAATGDSLKNDNEDDSYENFIPNITNKTGNPLATKKLTPTNVPEAVTISDNIQINYTLTDGVLTLETDSQKFEFEYVPQSEGKWYEDTAIDGDLTLYDMDGDGRDELLVSLSDHVIIETLVGPTDGSNWKAVWCLILKDDNTLELAEGVAAAEFRGITLSNSGGSNKLILDEYNVYYTLNGSELELHDY